MNFLIPEEEIPKNIPLVVVLHGFSDAGNSVAQTQKFLKKHHDLRLVYSFKNDDFLDYRARRPSITFEKDHLQNYDPQSLALYLTKDELGAPFLLLMGYEPDFRWEEFVDTIVSIVEKFSVLVTVWTHSIPMPVPHTRPIGVTVSGNRADLIEMISVWKPTTRLSASVGHVLEHRLYGLDQTVAGFVLLVPHYLANTDYPDALKVSLESIMDATGLLFSTEAISAKETDFHRQVDEQINDNEESVEMVRNLENRYDEYMRSRVDSNTDSDFVEEQDVDLPTGDQLADQFEKLLAQHWEDEAGDGTQDRTD